MSTSTGATGTDITTDSVRELLSDRKVFPGLPDDLGEDAELVLDFPGVGVAAPCLSLIHI